MGLPKNRKKCRMEIADKPSSEEDATTGRIAAAASPRDISSVIRQTNRLQSIDLELSVFGQVTDRERSKPH